ncbi:MAG TPA: hypothetical protein PK993_02295 [Clostridia bacterium]|nr:hypothetical protein [Clostridia bacterium]
MVDRFYGYQSETSPREIQPEYRPYRNNYTEKSGEKKIGNTNSKNNNTKGVNKNDAKNKNLKKQIVVNTENINNISKNKTLEIEKKAKKSIKPRVKLLFLVAAGFSVLFIISYRNSIINETFSKKESLKNELSSVQKTNEQLQVSIENSLNLNNVEKEAKERVGMQKLTNSQKVYVSLEKKDYVESATEEIIIEEQGNIINQLFKSFNKTI